ncbi:ComEA family DNA-binding protein [Sphingobacterium bovistauri]|uniref:Helix-hairpin-helix domain-containing protein n=1 Tax=Sphingobacterium bovistauri TaxID=2781959 RepID=A0ABS7Z7M8_9SPHI|nr:helix-hairpin-helix domain-containing protein [Sphingobacterium bovistauri]MCA5004870.1 helix-hairpin-helix domain-containing protein [Sphingobacterium bovistauri]
MNRFFKYFQFNIVERNGFVVLLALIAIVNIAVLVYKKISPKDVITHRVYNLNSSSIAHTVDNEIKDEVEAKNFYNRKDNISYFNFNPNQATVEDWSKLGFSIKQIKVITNYIAKGGRFYKKEDLKKIYSISESDYNKLERYIVIPSEKPSSQIKKAHFEMEPKMIKSKPIIISINTADTTDLKKLRGIGTVFAGRIVKFRDALGGFHSINQLKEVYGMSEETFDQIKENINIQPEYVNKLQVNLLDANELAKHPYVSKKQANAIVNYRNQHGKYANVEMMTKNKALDQDFLRKIEPYLAF